MNTWLNTRLEYTLKRGRAWLYGEPSETLAVLKEKATGSIAALLEAQQDRHAAARSYGLSGTLGGIVGGLIGGTTRTQQQGIPTRRLPNGDYMYVPAPQDWVIPEEVLNRYRKKKE